MAVSYLRILLVLHCVSLCWPINTLTAVLQSVEKMLNYYKENVKDMNVDGLFGLRVLEGQLEIIVKKLTSQKVMSQDLLQRLRTMLHTAHSAAKVGLNNVKNDDPTYYRQMYVVISKPWTVWGADRMVNKSVKWSYEIYSRSKMRRLSEEASDDCMMEIMGTSEGHKPCSFSRKCTQIMTMRGLTHYGITHQILWSMLAQMNGCKEELNRSLRRHSTFKSMEDFREEMCSNNYYESLILVHDYMRGVIYPGYQDLFLEQQFICAAVGYGAFLRRSYLSQILSWQHDCGCYGRHMRTKVPVKPSFIAKFYGEVDQMIDAVYGNREESNKNVAQFDHIDTEHHEDEKVLEVEEGESDQVEQMEHRVKLRKLLVEKDMPNGCLSHKTAVAAGALSVYLRYLLFPSYSQQGHVASEHLSETRDILPEELVDKFEKDEKTQPNTLGEEDWGREGMDEDMIDRPEGVGRVNPVENSLEETEDDDKVRSDKMREVADRFGKDKVRFVHPVDLVHDSQTDPSKNLALVLFVMSALMLLLLVRYCMVRSIRIRGRAYLLFVINKFCGRR